MTDVAGIKILTALIKEVALHLFRFVDLPAALNLR